METPVPEPVTVTWYVPAVVLAAALTLSVAVVDPAAMLAGFGVTVSPAGAPETARFTAPANPFARAMVTVELPDAPCAKLNDVGERLIEKLGVAAAVTVSATEAV